MLLTSRENLRIRALNQTAEAMIAASGAAHPHPAIRNSAGQRFRSRSATTAGPRPSREIAG